MIKAIIIWFVKYTVYNYRTYVLLLFWIFKNKNLLFDFELLIPSKQSSIIFPESSDIVAKWNCFSGKIGVLFGGLQLSRKTSNRICETWKSEVTLPKDDSTDQFIRTLNFISIISRYGIMVETLPLLLEI